METRPTEVEALVARLNNLHEIFRVQGEILACGEATVAPLSELLLSSPSGFPEPRVAAAECLGAIGGDTAVDALIRVLDYHNLDTLGPVQRFAEETIRNVAARRLAQFDDSRVRHALLMMLQRDHLIGAGQALAHLGDARAIPYLIECLEDDYKKGKATKALRRFGQAAVGYLCDAVQRPRFVEGVEPPLSQERRFRAAELLGDIKAPEAIPPLEAGLLDESEPVRLACALALVRIGVIRPEILKQLIRGLDDSDAAVRMECEDALRTMGIEGASLLAEAACGHAIPWRGETAIQLSLSGRLLAIKILSSSRAPETGFFLTHLLRDADEIVRYRAIAALENFKTDEAGEALERAARQDPSRRVRIRAKQALQVVRKGIISRFF